MQRPKLYPEMNKRPIKKRNPLLVVIWSFGLFILMHTSQYSGIFLASKMVNVDFGEIASGAFTNHYSVLYMGLNVLILGIPIVFVIIRYLWGRDLRWMCLDVNLKLFFYGAILGLLLPIFILVILSLFDAVHVTGYPSRFSFVEIGSVLIGYFGLALFTGIVEEVVFRGMAAREFATRYGWKVAAIVSGIYFGMVHLLPKIPTLSIGDVVWIIFGAMIVGILFVAMLVKSRSLWLPIGFHLTWNFSLSAIIGTTMSGDESSLGLFKTEVSGSPILTGGKFGIELSVITLLAYVLVTIVLIYIVPNSKSGILESNLPVEGDNLTT